MSMWSGNAIISKAKSIYGKCLKEKDYLELVKMKSISDVVSYLKNQACYTDILTDINESSVHRGQLEEMIKKNAFNHTLKLVKFVHLKDSSFYKLNIIQRENDLILATIRSMISDSYEEAFAELPMFLKQHASFDIMNLSRSKNFEELLEVLKGTDYYNILKPHMVKDNNDIKYVDIEHDLEIYFYDCAFKRIDENYRGKLNRDLTNIFKTRIELGNIIKIYRLKKFYKADPEIIKKTLINKYSRLSESKIEHLISLDDPDAVLQYLEKSEFAKFVDEQDYVYVEYYAERIKYNLARKYMYFSNEIPKVYSAFLILIEIEIENLTNIIECIRYQLDENEIKRMLIY